MVNFLMSKVKGQRSKGKGLVFSNQQQKQKRWRGSAASINKKQSTQVCGPQFCVP